MVYYNHPLYNWVGNVIPYITQPRQGFFFIAHIILSNKTRSLFPSTQVHKNKKHLNHLEKKNNCHHLQGGPPTSYKYGYNSTYRVITPVTQL